MNRRWIAALVLFVALLPFGQPAASAQEVGGEGFEPTGERAIALALSMVGHPYVWAGASPAGFDCSGLTTWVYRQLGFELPRDVNGQFLAGQHVDAAELEPGDLLIFQNTYQRGLSHVGIYLGDGQFIHADEPGVVVSRLWTDYWTSRFVVGVRVA